MQCHDHFQSSDCGQMKNIIDMLRVFSYIIKKFSTNSFFFLTWSDFNLKKKIDYNYIGVSVISVKQVYIRNFKFH